MARRSIPSFDVLWERHTSIYADVFIAALSLLTSKKPVAGDEDAISEFLCPMLSQVCFEINQKGRGEVRVPAWERPLQPVVEEELRDGQLGKRPDFTCSCLNHFASRAEEAEIPFHVECKLLGNPTSPSWNLNKNYVVRGMMRFDSMSHAYGKRASSGMMIGYISDLSPNAVALEVNNRKTQYLGSWPDIVLCEQGTSIHRAEQIITRLHVTPSEFILIHLWVDLRQNA